MREVESVVEGQHTTAEDKELLSDTRGIRRQIQMMFLRRCWRRLSRRVLGL
jgi:hypothetical protein